MPLTVLALAALLMATGAETARGSRPNIRPTKTQFYPAGLTQTVISPNCARPLVRCGGSCCHPEGPPTDCPPLHSLIGGRCVPLGRWRNAKP